MAGGRRLRSFEAMRTHSPNDRDRARSPVPVRLEHLTKRYGSITAVDDLSFEIRDGAVTGFLGPNGAGKTTALRLLLGLANPTAGTATIFGRPYAELEDPLATVGAVLETATFHPWRTARQHLRVLAAAAGIARERVEEVLRLVGLAEAANRRVGGFSLGMRQRLGLAGALLGRPRLLILDEPTNGLDPEGIRWLRDLLRAYAADGNSVLISSHLLSEVAQTVDDVVIIANGSTRAQCTLQELEAQTNEAVEIRSANAAELRGRLAALGIQASASGPQRLTVAGASAEAIGEIAALGGIPLSGMTTTRSDLEAVFLELTSPTPTSKETA
jgi:ABC-2 type transport system ATP-binding protein